MSEKYEAWRADWGARMIQHGSVRISAFETSATTKREALEQARQNLKAWAMREGLEAKP